MDTARLRAFMAAVKEGTIKDASEKLGYTPSAISQLIAAMENDLNILLLERGRKGVTLTDSGKRILPIVQNILDYEEQLYQTASEINNLLRGEIRIGSFSSIATFWLPSVIQSFQNNFPGIKISLQEGPWQEVHQWLDNKEIDVAFCSYSKNSFHDFIPLAKDKLVAMLPKNHPMAKRKNFPIDKLSGEKLILPQEGKYCNAVLMLKEKNIPFNIYLTTKEVYASMGMVSQGLGITVLNELITQGWHNRTVIIPIEPVYTITLGIELPSISKASPAAKVFVKHAVKMLKKI